jgi:sporulation integral membrane protein YtvI
MTYKKTVNKKKLIKLLLLTLAVAVSIYLSFKLLKYVFPFVLAFIFSAIIKPTVEFLNVKLKIRRGLSTLICTLIFFIIIGTIMFFLVIAMINQISGLVRSLPEWLKDISKPLSNIITSLNHLSEYFPNLSDELSSSLDQISVSLMSSLTSIAADVGQFIINRAVSIPGAIIFIFITVLSTYFYTKDRKYFKDLLSKQLPDSWIETFYDNRKKITGTLIKWLKAQGIILSITFSELLIAFSIIGIKYSLILAMIIALIDILPVLGTGTIMIPWILISFFSGNSDLAVKLLIIYVAETAIRQFIEPRIVGRGIGIHPLITLLAMYIGVYFFGVLGFLLGPIYIMIFKNVMLGILNGKKITEYISLRTKEAKPDE